ncbi:MAG: hypothetical protein ACOCWG_01120 [bacterium]
MLSLIRIILFAIIIYYIIKLIIYVLVPLIRNVLGHQHVSKKGKESNGKRKGNIIINEDKNKEKKIKKNEGDYVDYEEIKDQE